MNEFRIRLLGTVLTYTAVYAVLATVLVIRPVEELNTGVIWAVMVLGLGSQTAIAIGDVYATVVDWRARRKPQPVRRPASLADYMPGATSPQQRVDRAA